MRIAMVCPYSVGRPGGVQGQALGLATALRERDHRVTVVAPDEGVAVGTVLGDGGEPVGHWQPGERPPDATVVAGRSVGLRANGSVAPVALSPASAGRVRRLVDSGGYDLAHLHEPLAPVLGYGCLWSARVPMVGTFHRSGDTAWYRVLGPLARRATARLGARVAVSDAAQAHARAATGGHYEVLFNGIDLRRFADAAATPTSGPTVLFLGRHEPRKGLAVLLEAFDRLAAPARLWVGGDGPESAALRRAYPDSDRRTWLGRLSDDQATARLLGADVLCAPSLAGESFGIVLLEGLAAHCTVVASDLPGYRAAAGGHAVLVPPGDSEALSGALGRALAETVDGAGRAAAAARRAGADRARRWSMDRLAGEYEDRYERVVGGSAGARK